MWLLLWSVGAFAGGLEDVRPRNLQEEAAAFATDADGRVVALVDASDTLWVGRGRLRRLGDLSFTPDRIVSGDPLILSHTERAGLIGHTDWAVLSIRGDIAEKGRHPGRLIDSTVSDGVAALLFADVLIMVGLADQATREVPLPFLRPQTVVAEGDFFVVSGEDRAMVEVGRSDGCPVGLGDELPKDDLEAMRWREAARLCGAPPRLSDERLRRAKVHRSALIEQAIRESDADLLVGLQPPGGIERLRPDPVARMGAVRTREEAQVSIEGQLVDSNGLTTVYTDPSPGIDLRPWASGPYAPACTGTIVFAPSDADVAARLATRVQAAVDEGLACAHELRVAQPGQVSNWKDSVFYVEPSGRVRGGRNGGISARRVRMDQAWLNSETDPLGAIAEAPELVPEWSEGPGPGFGPIIDVDGSWIAAAGWDLIRGPFNAYRVERAQLGGTVSHLRVRRDGRIEARSGGVVAAAVMDTGEVEWGGQLVDNDDAYPVLAPRTRETLAVDPGPWRLAGDRSIQASAKFGGEKITLPVPVRHVENRRSGTVLYTDLGLLGIDSEGTFMWRLTDTESWAIEDSILVGSTPFGVSGWRLPY